MTLKSFPFQDVSGDRLYSDVEFADFYAKLFKDGVIQTLGTGLQVKASSPTSMTVTVSDGAAIIQGRQLVNDSNYSVTLAAASSTASRTDSVVIQLNLPLRQITVVYKQGSVAVQRDANIFELQLATITVPKNASSISGANITDKRYDSAVCGYSSPYVTVNVESLQDQYTTMLNEAFDTVQTSMETDAGTLNSYLIAQQSAFDTWFAALQDNLATNTEASLQAEIDALTADTTFVTITHNLNLYPDVRVLTWEYGLGLQLLGNEPAGLFGGSNAITVPCSAEYLSKQAVIVRIPLIYSMVTPTIKQLNEREWLFTSGMKSLQVTLMEA